MAQWDTGRLVAARYRLVRALGEGGLGRAHLARDEVRDELVVLKTVKKRADGERLAQEVELLRGLYHSSLVTALDLFVDDGRPVLVTDFIDGVTIAEAARSWKAGATRSTPWTDAARDLASAVALLHAMGIVHGDIKSANVLVDADGVKLIDLSAARRGAGPSAGVTFGQSAPETETRLETSFASDVFALAQLIASLAPPPSIRARLVDALAEAPAERPTARELAERLGADTAKLEHATLQSRLMARGEELALLAEMAARPGASALVVGDAGVGKTRLLREAQWRAALHRPVFAQEPGEDLAALIGRAFASGAPKTLAEAIDLSRTSSDRSPCLLVVDDFDRASARDLGWVRALVARQDLSVSWLLAARSPPDDLLVSRVRRLEPLAAETVRQWLEGTSFNPAKVRAAEGNPRAVLQRARTKGEPATTVDRRSSAAMSKHPNAEARILALLRAATRPLARAVMAAFESDLSSLDALIVSDRIVRAQGGFLGTDSASSDDPTTATATAIERAAHGFLLAQASTSSERLVHAAMAGDRPATVAAMGALVREAEAPGPDLVRAARRLIGAPLGDARVFAAHVLERAGDGVGAAEALMRAVLRAPRSSAPQIRLTLARLRVRRGDARGLRVLRGMVGTAARIEETILLLKLGNFGLARDVANETLARANLDPETTRELEISRALAESWLGHLDAPVARLLELASAPAMDKATPRARYRAKNACATVLLRAGDAARARIYYQAALTETRAFGLDDLALPVSVNLAVADHQAGDYGRAHEGYVQAIDLARAARSPQTAALVVLYIARLYADLDLFGRAREALDRCDHAALSVFLGASYLCLAAEIATAEGALGDARTLADRAIAACADAPRERTEASLVRLNIALQAKERELARELITRLEPEVAGEGARDLAARRAELAARLAAEEGRSDLAVKLARSSLEHAEATRKPRLRVRAHALLDEMYTAAGASAAAEPHRMAAERLREELWVELPRELRPPPYASSTRAAIVASTGIEPASSALVDALVRLTGAENAQELHALAVEEALRLTRAERGFLLLREDSTSEPVVVSAKNVDREAIKKPRNKYGRTIARRTMDSGETQMLLDADGSSTSTAHRLGLRSVLCVPLFHEGRATGALYLDNRFATGAFEASDARAVRSLVDALASLRARFAREADLEAALATASHARAPADRDEAPPANLRLLPSPFPEIATRSAAFVAALTTLSRVVDVDVPVLVRGESGTGKELAARALHAHGTRKRAPFVAINCGALPEALLEAELFGYTRGAFTGATTDKAGLFVAAEGGTLFLDEIGEMPPAMQVKLLRVVQEREVRPLGATRHVPIDVRIVSATHRDLQREVAEGRFREDLYYRIAVVEATLPPLRDRLEDIGLLAEIFMDRLRRQSGIARTLSASTRAPLARHAWPGNVRELENAIVRAFFLADGDVVTEIPGLEGSKVQTNPQIARSGKRRRGEDERRLILETLAREEWNMRRVAKILGIPRATFYRRLEAYKIVRVT